MSEKKQIPALPPLDEAPADDDRFAIRDTSSGSDKSLRVDRFLERAVSSQELLAAVSEAADIDEAVSFVGKGAIVESGSTPDGHYVRWENGEQMATRHETRDFNNTTSPDYDFPASFVSRPATSLSFDATTSSALINIYTDTAISVSETFWRILVGTTGDHNQSVRMTAWGFWK